MKVAAFDAPKSIVEQLKSGLVNMAIAQHPAEIGYFGVVAAYAALAGQSIPTTIGTGFTVIDQGERRRSGCGAVSLFGVSVPRALTLPSLRDGPLPLPQAGEGLVPRSPPSPACGRGPG